MSERHDLPGVAAFSHGATSRREWLRVGGIGCLGLSLANLFESAAQGGNRSSRFGRAKSCLIVFLSGGPPQHETFDPKPEASTDIRGEFHPIGTSVPGTHFCELLPLIARQAHELAIVRSMTSGTNSHSASGFAMFTGQRHPQAALEVAAEPTDWPALSGVIAKLLPSQRSPLSAVTIPERLVNNPGVPWPGQTGGFMGSDWDPHLLTCDPAAPDFKIDALTYPEEVSNDRFTGRTALLAEFDRERQRLDRLADFQRFDGLRRQALELLQSSSTRTAFDLGSEPATVRDRYGRHKFGQSVLLGRRLIEAGVRLVQVNFPREPGDLSVGNPLWDTHQDNARRLKASLCPPFDQGFSALIEDLSQSGLLDETLVIALGEFGRSPKINGAGGRDHWGDCFSVVFAGAGIAGGQTIGASDKNGGLPANRPFTPGDLAATICHFLGLPPDAEFYDKLNRPRRVADGKPIAELVG